IHLAETTEINGIVIDVKEVCGPQYSKERLKKLIDELHAKHIWAIARIVVFKDSSQIDVHPEWYLKRAMRKTISDQCANKTYLRAKNSDGGKSNAIFWRDNNGGYWLDPASKDAQMYIADFTKHIIDLGFDEIQFDYIRFPSDGDVEKAQFPVWDGKRLKFMILKDFFEFLHATLKKHKPDIILSADLFGYAAIREGDVGIGQRLEDIGNSFDYVSFMVYPSHYYSGLTLPADLSNNLPAIAYDKRMVRAHPDVTVGRSLQIAKNFLDNLTSSTTAATSTPIVITDDVLRPRLRLRPWLEDFFHEADRVAGRPYGIQKVRLQIDAAEKVGGHGWLLWNAANV
ncbi:MAG: putative glycoside hydrolase, partial [Patescibacteria group bacterium]